MWIFCNYLFWGGIDCVQLCKGGIWKKNFDNHWSSVPGKIGEASPAGYTNGKAAQRLTKDRWSDYYISQPCLVPSWCGARTTRDCWKPRGISSDSCCPRSSPRSGYEKLADPFIGFCLMEGPTTLNFLILSVLCAYNNGFPLQRTRGTRRSNYLRWDLGQIASPHCSIPSHGANPMWFLFLWTSREITYEPKSVTHSRLIIKRSNGSAKPNGLRSFFY